MKDFEIDMKASFYCGDAAGRPKTATKPKDFTDTDLKFAVNVGLPFKTPEELFLGEKETRVPKIESFFKKADATSAKEEKKVGAAAAKATAPVNYASDKQELVLFFGPPGCGKSTFWSNHFSKYERISQDALGSSDKCIKACKAALGAGKSAVIDNTNKTLEQRSRYTSIAAA